jgi:DNA-binding FadR family transcriptional regulator
MAERYFENPQARAASQRFYRDLRQAAHDQDGTGAAEITERAMRESIALWRERHR